MVRNVIAFLLVSSLLAGCASSPYQPTTKQVAISKQLTTAQAVQVLESASREIAPATQYGICRVSVRRDHGSPVTVDEKGFHFKAYHKGEFIKEDAKYRYYEKDAYTAHFDFADMTEVAYQDNRDGAALACGGKFLITTAGNNGIIMFGLSQDKVDSVLAALMKLAPQAKLTQTSSF